MNSEHLEYQRKFHKYVLDLQNKITKELEIIDPKIKLTEDHWKRKDYLGNDGGGGITRAFEGDIIENAGVNTSFIFGEVDPHFAKTLYNSSGGNVVSAAGISLIIHPTNPKMPTTHANFRMIIQGNNYWFGGGADLTPYYPIEDDFKYFHSAWKKACAPYKCYEKMKKECDDYFTNHHRNYQGIPEMRGVGGIFFDHFKSDNIENDYKMVTNLSEFFIPSYFPILKKRKNESYTKQDEEFQLNRRGRYVEFNLIHDRGTLFGLKSNGRIDSILISLPKRCNFTYQFNDQVTSSEHLRMLSYYKPIDW